MGILFEVHQEVIDIRPVDDPVRLWDEGEISFAEMKERLKHESCKLQESILSDSKDIRQEILDLLQPLPHPTS